jgi:hypothetical protein
LPMRRDSAQGHAVVIGQDPLPPVAQLGPLHSASPALRVGVGKSWC